MKEIKENFINAEDMPEDAYIAPPEQSDGFLPLLTHHQILEYP